MMRIATKSFWSFIHAATGCLSVACLLVGAATSAADFHVAPDGRPEGSGSPEDPWDLATALDHPHSVRPGDSIWLHGGTYQGTFTSRLTGTAEQPIVVRQLPGQRAILDAGAGLSRATTLAVHGEHTWFQGFEITNSSPQRVTNSGGSHPEDLTINGSVDVYSGTGHKLINLVIHHCAAGPSAWVNARDTEVLGCLVFNNGWDAPDRGHGHAFYWQNNEGTKRLVDNIFFNQFSHGIHFYGSSRAFLNNFHVEGNIGFNNGALSKRSGYSRNILIGGGRRAENVAVVDNLFYYTQKGGNILGYGQGTGQLTVRGNQFFSMDGSAVRLQAERLSLSGNTFLGSVEGIRSKDHPENEFLGNQRPTGVTVFVRPNRHEPGRAHVAILNWDRREDVDLDLSAIGLRLGDHFVVRDVQDYFGEPLVSGRYDDAPVTVRLTGLTAAIPVGRMPLVPLHTGPELAVFVVQRAVMK